MNKENIEKIVNEYLEHVRRYSWQYGVTNEEKMNKFLKSDVVKNLIIPGVSNQRGLFENMQYYMEYCEANGYVTPQDWIEKHKHF